MSGFRSFVAVELMTVLLTGSLAGPAAGLPDSRSATTDVAYETRYVEGTLVFVGKHSGLEVRMSARKGSDLAVTLYVVNGSDEPVTFYPDEVIVEAVHEKGGEVTRQRIRRFSADEYASRVRTSLAWRAIGLADVPPQNQETYHISGTDESHDWTTGSSVSSYYSGTVIKEPSAADRAAAQEQAQARLDRAMAPHEARGQEIISGLMRTQTLDAHTAYGGTIYAKTKGKDYAVTVPFGGVSFEFSFTFK